MDLKRIPQVEIVADARCSHCGGAFTDDISFGDWDKCLTCYCVRVLRYLVSAGGNTKQNINASKAFFTLQLYCR